MSLPDFNAMIKSIENTIKNGVDGYKEAYVFTIDRGASVIDMGINATYIELNNWFAILDDMRENISTFFGLLLVVISAGAFVSLILLGDKVILVLQAMPKLFESISLVKL